MQDNAVDFSCQDEVVEFNIAYQPIVDITAKEIFGYEALLRGPQGCSPKVVLQSVPLDCHGCFDHHIRKAAVSQLIADRRSEKISLNFSTSSLVDDKNYLSKLLDHAENNGLNLEEIIVEISESDVIQGIDGLTRSLGEASARGALIAIDDFGAGYAGLNSLIDVNPDIIKLDMYLIRGIHTSGVRQATVRALVSLAMDLGIDLIAEGVEEDAEIDFLKASGIDLFQGFKLARPEMSRFLEIADITFLSSDL